MKEEEEKRFAETADGDRKENRAGGMLRRLAAGIAVFVLAIALAVMTPMLSRLGIVGGLISRGRFVTNVLGSGPEDRQDALWQYYTDGGRDSVITRERLIDRINAVDSLEREVLIWRIYGENIARILDGSKEGVVGMDSLLESNLAGMRTKEEVTSLLDTLLRRRVAGDIETKVRLNRQGEFLNMFRPVVGKIISPFNRSDKSITIAVQDREPVYAISNGTVVLTAWNPYSGYIVQMQHSGNLISSYSNISRLMVKDGDIIGRGAIIGYVGEALAPQDSVSVPAVDTKYLRFTLWHEGNAVDPENYILF